MNPIKDLKCWEIVECDNQECTARRKPETRCWEIAKREGAYKDISSTCRDCIVYVLKEEIGVLSRSEIEKIITQKNLAEKIKCVLLARSQKSST